MCIGNELFFTSVYLLYFHSGPGNISFYFVYSCAPVFHFLQFYQYWGLEHGGLFCLVQLQYLFLSRWSALFNSLKPPRVLLVWILQRGHVVARKTVTNSKIYTNCSYCLFLSSILYALSFALLTSIHH